MTLIPPGTYRINTALFTVQGVKVLDIPDNMVGVVTTKEGKPLAAGEIASPPVKGHNSFQDAQSFVDAGGGKGLQEQVVLAGRYFINPRFATVEIKETTIVPIANVGDGHDRRFLDLDRREPRIDEVSAGKNHLLLQALAAAGVDKRLRVLKRVVALDGRAGDLTGRERLAFLGGDNADHVV